MSKAPTNNHSPAQIMIEVRRVDRLIPYARNSRTHSEAQVAQVAASIREFGFTNPVLVDGDDGIIAGHGRVMAARKLGMDEVPVIVLRHLTPAQKKAYIIADNKLALNAGWNDALLKIELSDLAESAFDLNLMGFDAAELGAIMFPEEPGEAGDDDEGSDEAPGVIIQYNVVFDDEAQQRVWFDLLRALKGQYPDLETIGARLTAFVEENPIG